MDNLKSILHSSEDVEQNDVRILIEDIRLTTLNIAISAAKLDIEGESKTVIRKKVSELVNLTLGTVNDLANMLGGFGRDLEEEEEDPAAYMAKLKEVEEVIQKYSSEIRQLLAESDDDKGDVI